MVLTYGPDVAERVLGIHQTAEVRSQHRRWIELLAPRPAIGFGRWVRSGAVRPGNSRRGRPARRVTAVDISNDMLAIAADVSVPPWPSSPPATIDAHNVQAVRDEQHRLSAAGDFYLCLVRTAVAARRP